MGKPASWAVGSRGDMNGGTMLLRYFYVVLLGVSVLFALSSSRANAQGASTDPDLVARGKYLATAADCKLCHTSSKDKPLRRRI